MIKQLLSKEFKEYIKTNSKRVLIDVRTEEEWNMFGKPDGWKLGLKTYFLTVKDENFIHDFNKLFISKDYEIFTLCKVGQRSQFVAELLEKNDYKCVNISDGFDGWQFSDLPCF